MPFDYPEPTEQEVPGGWMMTTEKLAETAYEAYRNHDGGVSQVSGEPIPEWGDVSSDMQAKWMAMVRAIVPGAGELWK